MQYASCKSNSNAEAKVCRSLHFIATSLVISYYPQEHLGLPGISGIHAKVTLAVSLVGTEVMNRIRAVND